MARTEIPAATLALTHPDAYATRFIRPFPVRSFRAPKTHAAAVAHIVAVRMWWVDVAAHHVALAEMGCVESLHDAREAMRMADALAPKAVAA